MSAARSLPSTRVERGGADDLDAVMAIMDSAFDRSFGEAWTRAQCSGIMPMAGVRLSIARIGDGGALGFTLSRAVAYEAELLLLAVLPAERGRGVGTALLEAFVLTSREAGVRRLLLEVRDGNRAIAMYLAHGFEIAGRRRHYYRGPDGAQYDALTLARSL